MQHLRTLAPIGALALSLVAASSAPAAGTQNVKIAFKAVAGSQPVACGTAIPGLGSAKEPAQLKDLRFFVSDVKLLRKDGSSATVKIKPNKDFRVSNAAGSVTLIDLENGTGACAEEGTPATNAAVLGTVPKGSYVGASWTVGVPFKLNHTDSVGAPGPLRLAAMAWSWQYGRKFVKIEVADPAGATGGTWAAPIYYLHVGSTGCEGNPATGGTVSCLAANRSSVKLSKFNPARQQVAVDLGTLFAGDDLSKSPDEMPGCMSGPDDPECGPLFGALGVGWSADGKSKGLPTGKQTVFRAINR